MRNTLLANYLQIICKTPFGLCYGDIIYHQPNNESMNNKLESVHIYNAALAIKKILLYD